MVETVNISLRDCPLVHSIMQPNYLNAICLVKDVAETAVVLLHFEIWWNLYTESRTFSAKWPTSTCKYMWWLFEVWCLIVWTHAVQWWRNESFNCLGMVQPLLSFSTLHSRSCPPSAPLSSSSTLYPILPTEAPSLFLSWNFHLSRCM